MEDRRLKCPESPDGDGFLQHESAGGILLESSGAGVSEGLSVQIPPETGSVELKGFVSSDAGFPEHLRPVWMVVADQEGACGGAALSSMRT